MAIWRTALTALFVFATASGANAACDPFPKSEYLGDFSHAQVKSYVSKAHNGDWAPYLAMLQNNVSRLQALQMSGDGTILNVRGSSVDVSPSELIRFVYVSRQWMSVAQCLSGQQTMVSAPSLAAPSLAEPSLDDFTTAAGNGDGTVHYFDVPDARTLKETSLGSLESEVASLSINRVSVDVSTRCVAGDTIFTVKNTGAKWPDTGIFGIYRIDGPNRQMISGRRLILEPGEIRKFKISERQNLTGELGISVEPSWYTRPFTMDGGASCK